MITIKDGRIVNDQKNNGIYELSERPVPKMPVRVVQTPGHALKRPVSSAATRKPSGAQKSKQVNVDVPRRRVM